MTQVNEPFLEFTKTEALSARPLRALIDLAMFKQNVSIIKSKLPDSQLIVVVKADAYGHGLKEIANASADHSLAVAIPEELAQLRQAGIQSQVWVMEGPFTLACFANSNNVVWVVHSLWQIELIKTALKDGLTSKLTVCIKIDTGMHRLGFDAPELSFVADFLLQNPQINLYATMTHFSMSDEANHASVFNQITLFDQLVKANNWGHVKQTLANSGGIMMYPESHRHWVRPGIMLYSGESAIKAFNELQPVMHFESAIIALRNVKKGQAVGYGASWVAARDSKIATVAVGYADGYPRHAPNGTPVGVVCRNSGTETLAHLVGRVSMDMITIDVTDIQDVSIGDKVELWGRLVSVGDVASLSGTISYELLTSVSKRVPREYIS